MFETEKFDVAERVAMSKARLSEKLSELGRRVDHFRDKANVAKVVGRPWFLFAAATLVGFVVGIRRPRRRLALPAAAGAPPPHPSIPRALVREVLLAAAGAATRRYIAHRQLPNP